MSFLGNARGILLAVAWVPLQGSDWAGADDFYFPFLSQDYWGSPVQQVGEVNLVPSSSKLNFEIPSTGLHTSILPWKHTLPGTEGWYVEALITVPTTQAPNDLLTAGLLISTNTTPQFGGEGIVMRVENQVEGQAITRRLIFEEIASGEVHSHYDQTMNAEDTSVRLKFQFLKEANFTLYCFEDSPGIWLCVAATTPQWNLEGSEGLTVAAFTAANLTLAAEGNPSMDDFYIYQDEADKDSDGIALEQENSLGTNPYAADSDKDGLTDAEEINTYNTNPLLADSDEDSFWDGLEIQAGGNPLEKSSLPSLMSPSFQAGSNNRSLQIQTFPGLTYQIQHSTNLVDWTNQGEVIVGTGASQAMDLGVSQETVEFYRIQITD
jgi:hypothetical protein